MSVSPPTPNLWQMHLPLPQARIGAAVHCPLEPDRETDALFRDWECPLIWKWVSSRLKIDDAFQGQPALRFHFARRTPAEVWKTNWSLWYDTALVTRNAPPDDLTLRATLTFEEVTTGYGSDNAAFVRPWTGIVARMQDLRRYYFLCLEFPDRVVLYRREDNHWTRLAYRSCEIYPFVAQTLELRLRGNFLEASLDGKRVFAVTDYAFSHGLAGLRATSESFVTEFSLQADTAATQRFHQQTRRRKKELDEARARHPQPELAKVMDLPESGTVINARMAHFLPDGQQPQLFYSLADSRDGATACLRTLEGEEVWRTREHALRGYWPAPQSGRKGAHLIAFSDDAILLIDGGTGSTIHRRPFASLPDPPSRMRHLPAFTADLTGKGSPRDFLFTAGPNDPRIWALDQNLELLWHFRAPSGTGHDHHVCACDINGDGREEVFVGGSLLAADGQELWRQEEWLRQRLLPNAGHVDSAQMGFFGDDPAIPYLHLQGSSGGHLVADARDGSTVALHPQGHVQGGCAARLIPGHKGIQIAASCRHGNYGLLAIYSGEGRLLSRFQPDYRTDSPASINWDGSGTELLLLAHDPRRAALFNGQGQPVVPLQSFLPRNYLPAIPSKQRDFIPVPLSSDPDDSREWLLARIGHRIHFLAPSGPPPPQTYRPKRRGKISS